MQALGFMSMPLQQLTINVSRLRSMQEPWTTLRGPAGTDKDDGMRLTLTARRQ